MFDNKKRGFTDLDGNIVELERATGKSAGYDIKVKNTYKIYPNSVTIFETGLKTFMQNDEFFMLTPRSGLAIKRGLVLKNIVGIIDADYKDEILVAIWNTSNQEQTIYEGERIAQGIFMKYLTNGDKPSETRQGGLGSTGV